MPPAKEVVRSMHASRPTPHARRRAAAAALLAVGAALALAACGDDGTTAAGTTAPPPVTAPATTDAPSTETTPPTDTSVVAGADVTAFFPESGGEALVRATLRVAAAGDPLVDAMSALAAGPQEPGLDPGLPDGTRVVSAVIGEGGVATVDLTAPFADAYPSGGAAAEFRALAPLVYTATAVPGVVSVLITVDGAAPDVDSQFDLSLPLRPEDLPTPAEIR